VKSFGFAYVDIGGRSPRILFTSDIQSVEGVPTFFLAMAFKVLRDTVPKPDYIFDLERRQQVLEEEIARALSLCSPDDPMVGDLKSRMLHLKEEIERFCNKAIADRRLH
jgi:hypothetical protein